MKAPRFLRLLILGGFLLLYSLVLPLLSQAEAPFGEGVNGPGLLAKGEFPDQTDPCAGAECYFLPAVTRNYSPTIEPPPSCYPVEAAQIDGPPLRW
jgi:hypothetical protein